MEHSITLPAETLMTLRLHCQEKDAEAQRYKPCPGLALPAPPSGGVRKGGEASDPALLPPVTEGGQGVSSSSAPAGGSCARGASLIHWPEYRVHFFSWFSFYAFYSFRRLLGYLFTQLSICPFT